jgi:glycerophosphoryl diester phosphodiesterase
MHNTINTLIPNPNLKIIGHRGVAGLRPENTLSSFRYAAELGLNWIEFDIRLTKSKHWVVIHDKTLDRTTNGHGLVSESNLEDLKKLQAGLWFNSSYVDERIPSLEETLELILDLNLQANIEVKGSRNNPQQQAEDLAKLLIKYCPNILPKPLISSFNLELLKILRKILPNFPTGYLIEKFEENTLSIVKEYAFTTINCDVDTMQDKYLTKAMKINTPVLLYTVNDKKVGEYWLSKGVSALFSDRPDLFT